MSCENVKHINDKYKQNNADKGITLMFLVKKRSEWTRHTLTTLAQAHSSTKQELTFFTMYQNSIYVFIVLIKNNKINLSC